MFSRAEPAATIAYVSEAERFSLKHLRKIYQQLFDNKSVNRANEELVVEILRVLAEMVVYGDNNSELLFDFFCEKNMLSLFLEIMWTEIGCPCKVHVQILQTLSILINCVRNETSLYYLLSNNYINEIIIYPHDFSCNQEGLCEQFVSFLKTLSLKLNVQTVQFFFIERTGAFPLLNKAIELLHYNEPMVRTAAQAAVLNIYQVREMRARQHALQDEIMHKFFMQIVRLMETQYSAIFRLSREYSSVRKAVTCREELDGSKEGSIDNESERKLLQRLEMQLNDVLLSVDDWLYYLQDVFSLNIMILRRSLVHHLITEFVYPVLLEPLKARSPCRERSLSSRNTVSGKAAELEREREEADAVDEAAATGVLASLIYLVKIYRFVTEKMLLRAISAATFHPLSRKGRKRTLHTIIQGRLSRSNSSIAAAAGAAAAERTQSGSIKQPSSSKDSDSSNSTKNTFHVVQSEKSVSSVGAASLLKIQHSPHTPEDFTNPYRAGFENLFASGNRKFEYLGMMLLYYQSDTLMSRDAGGDSDGWESKEEEGSLNGEVGRGIETVIDADQRVSVEGSNANTRREGVQTTWGRVEEEKEKERDLLEVPSVNAATLLHALGIIPLPSFGPLDVSDGAHAHAPVEGSPHPSSSSSSKKQRAAQRDKLNQAQSPSPSLPVTVPPCSATLETPTTLHSSPLSVKVEEEIEEVEHADGNTFAIIGSLSDDVDIADTDLIVNTNKSDGSITNSAVNESSRAGDSSDGRLEGGMSVDTSGLVSDSNIEHSANGSSSSSRSRSSSKNKSKSKSKNALIVVGEEVDDIEFLSEEEGLSALEPDVMSIYKLHSIAQYLRALDTCDLRLSIKSKKAHENLTVRNSVHKDRIVAGAVTHNGKDVNGDVGSESVCATSIGTTQFVDLELDSAIHYTDNNSSSKILEDPVLSPDVMKGRNVQAECSLNAAQQDMRKATDTVAPVGHNGSAVGCVLESDQMKKGGERIEGDKMKKGGEGAEGGEGVEGDLTMTARCVAQTFTKNILQQGMNASHIQSHSACDDDDDTVTVEAENLPVVSDPCVAVQEKGKEKEKGQKKEAALQSSSKREASVINDSKHGAGSEIRLSIDKDVEQHTRHEPSIFEDVLMVLLEDNGDHAPMTTQMGIRTIYTYVRLINRALRAVTQQRPENMASLSIRNSKSTSSKSCHSTHNTCDDVISERDMERESVRRDILSLSHVAERVHTLNVRNTIDMAGQLTGPQGWALLSAIQKEASKPIHSKAVTSSWTDIMKEVSNQSQYLLLAPASSPAPLTPTQGSEPVPTPPPYPPINAAQRGVPNNDSNHKATPGAIEGAIALHKELKEEEKEEYMEALPGIMQTQDVEMEIHRAVQMFLLVRNLDRDIRSLLSSPSDAAAIASLQQSTFLSHSPPLQFPRLTDGESLQVGHSYEMKGKRFLDSKIYKNTDLDFSPSIYIAEQPTVRSAPSSFSASANFFSFGLLGNLNGSGEPEEEGVPTIQGRSGSMRSYYFGEDDGYEDSKIIPTRIDVHSYKSKSSNTINVAQDSILNYPLSPSPSSTASSSSSPFQSPVKKGPGSPSPSPSPSPFSLRFNRRASEGAKRNPLFGGGSILGINRPFGSQSRDRDSTGKQVTDIAPRKSVSSKTYGETLFVQDDTQLIITTHSAASKSFTVHVLAPLAHTTSVVYAKDKKVLKILVHSPTPVLNMTLIGPCSGAGAVMGARDRQVFLNEKGNGSITGAFMDVMNLWESPALSRSEGSTAGAGDEWELLLLFDSEHSCHLANEHIRTTRKSLREKRLADVRLFLTSDLTSLQHLSLFVPFHS